MGVMVGENITALKHIEEAFRPVMVELPPLEPLTSTLAAYLKDVGCTQMSFVDTNKMLGGPDKAYYAICWTIAKVFLSGD